MPINLAPYGTAIEGGLSNALGDLDAAVERQNFFDYAGEQWSSRFQRDAESAFDYKGRGHRPSGFLRECVDVLCEHLYCPGPSRRWSEPAGDEVLQRVYADNHIDAVMQEADLLSTLNQVTAIQIDAGEGDYALKPITYRLWGREQFVVWTDANDSTKPIAIVTRDKSDEQSRYRLWSDTEVWTYTTAKVSLGGMGGRAPVRIAADKHDYGCLPFSFVHYRLPIRSFEVSCVGEFLHQAELRIDNRLNQLDESIAKHLNPIPVAEGVPPEWKPIVEPMRFIRMPLSGPILGPSGGYEKGEYAKLYFLQPMVDSAGAWDDLLKYINQALQAARVPLKAVSLDEMGVMSGIALIIEQAPLLTRARRRRGPAGVYETDLARRTLYCCGNHYGMSAIATAAEKGKLTLGWPQPSVPIPTPDALELATKEVEAGLKSHLMLIQQWYGIPRDQALELIKQINDDTAEVASMFPDLALPGPPTTQEKDQQAELAELAAANGKS